MPERVQGLSGPGPGRGQDRLRRRGRVRAGHPLLPNFYPVPEHRGQLRMLLPRRRPCCQTLRLRYVAPGLPQPRQEVAPQYDKVFEAYTSLLQIFEDCTTVGGQVRENGTTWSEGCNTCSCNVGKVDCSPRPCECAGDDLDLNCCPQCSLDPPDYGLGAEEATNVQPTLCRSSRSGMVLHRSGELWIEGCQECECVEVGGQSISKDH